MRAEKLSRIAIVGAGLQGNRRSQSLADSQRALLVSVASAAEDNARVLAQRYGAATASSWEEIIEDDSIDAVFVCTPPDSHIEITLAALEAGKHVMCEKPMAVNSKDAATMAKAAADARRVLWCGFNHRFHPGIDRIRAVIADDDPGAPLFVRCAYGISGRPGYADEWRCDPAVVSGGHLMEQGIHAIDLAELFLGPAESVTAVCETLSWDSPFEDNAMVLLRHAGGAMTTIHSTLSQWVNLFRFEVGFERSILTIDGLGGGYGDEHISISPRTDGPFATDKTMFRGRDRSWGSELAAFLDAVDTGDHQPLPHPGVRSLEVVEAAYRANREQTWIPT